MILNPSWSINSLSSPGWYVLSHSASQYLTVRTYIRTYTWASPPGYLIWLTYGQTYTERYTKTNSQNLPNITLVSAMKCTLPMFPCPPSAGWKNERRNVSHTSSATKRTQYHSIRLKKYPFPYIKGHLTRGRFPSNQSWERKRIPDNFLRHIPTLAPCRPYS